MNKIEVGEGQDKTIVPQKALQPETDKGRAWWGNVANGSVSISPDNIGRLNSMIDGKDNEQS